MLCLLFFCRFVFLFGKGDRADQKSRSYRSKEPLVQGGENGAGCAVPLLFTIL